MPSHQTFVSRALAIAIFLLTVTTLAQSQTADSIRKPAGSISGRVTLDGKAAPAILVAAVAGDTVNRRVAPARAVTDADGHYLISGLAPGQYQVWTLTPNMLADPNVYNGYFPFFGAIKAINLDGDEQVANIDLKLIRGAVITGRVTNSENKPVVGEAINLQLLDKNGNPILGAVPSTYDEMFQTDDRGIYRIYCLAPGRYKVATGEDPAYERFFNARRYERAFYLDPADQSKPGIVELAEGQVVENIDLRVQPAPPTFSIAGRVIDKETGAAIPRAGLLLNQVKKDARSGGLGIHADERGEFTQNGLAAGHYTVTPTSEFYGGNYYGDPVEVELVDKDLTGVEVKTTPGLSLSGVVVAEGLSIKELLTMLPGLTVTASVATANNQTRAAGGRAKVEPDGSFQVDGLRPGQLSIAVGTQSPTFVHTPVNRMERDGVPVTQNFDFQQSTAGLRVTVDYGTGTIRGTIKFEGDASVEFARIFASCRREGARDGSYAQVDTRGRFVIGNLAPGPYEVTIQIGGGTANNPFRPVPPQKQIVNITNGAETEVTFLIDLTRKP